MANTTLPTALYTVGQVRLLEKLTMSRVVVDNDSLMERAGLAAWQLLQEIWPAARQVVVVAGPGNNAGDGCVLARLAHVAGLTVSILTTNDPHTLSGAAQQAFVAAATAGVRIQQWDEEYLMLADVIVDAVFGIGLQRKVDAIYADVIAAINATQIPVLALDVPSGLCADTGRVLGSAVHAHVTLTFLGVKMGLCTGVALDYVGELLFHSLGVPDYIYAKVQPAAQRLTTKMVTQTLTPRARHAHKGDFGHVLVIGGDYGYAGAASMAAVAALKVGAGLVSVATRPEHVAVMVAQHPEIMAQGIQEATELTPLLARATVIVLGPGLGRSAWSQQLWLQAVATQIPMVVDADGLFWLATDPHVSRDWILTPHPGEAAKLLKTQVERVQLDRFHSALDLQQAYGGVAVLKGSGTIIQAEDSTPYVCLAGNPGMATGGMGDILSGIVGGLVAQKLPLALAAQIGVYIHAQAADLSAREGERGMVATDLLPYLRQLVNPGTSLWA